MYIFAIYISPLVSYPLMFFSSLGGGLGGGDHDLLVDLWERFEVLLIFGWQCLTQTLFSTFHSSFHFVFSLIGVFKFLHRSMNVFHCVFCPRCLAGWSDAASPAASPCRPAATLELLCSVWVCVELCVQARPPPECTEPCSLALHLSELHMECVLGFTQLLHPAAITKWQLLQNPFKILLPSDAWPRLWLSFRMTGLPEGSLAHLQIVLPSPTPALQTWPDVFPSRVNTLGSAWAHCARLNLQAQWPEGESAMASGFQLSGSPSSLVSKPLKGLACCLHGLSTPGATGLPPLEEEQVVLWMAWL